MIEPNADEQLPVLLAVSDGGPQMISGTTREFMALHALAMHVGRPGTPTGQFHIESLFGHVKTEWPHLEAIRDPIELDHALGRCAWSTIRSGSTPGSAASPRRRTRRTRRPNPQGPTRGHAPRTTTAHHLPSTEPDKQDLTVVGSFSDERECQFNGVSGLA